MGLLNDLRFHILAPIAASCLIGVTSAVFAQDGVTPLLDRLREIQNNPNASAVELKSATIILDRIVQGFPASEAAVSILLEESHEGIDFQSFQTRLAAQLAAPEQQTATAPATQLQSLVPAQPLAPIQPAVQGSPHLDCVVSLFQPQGQEPFQVRIETDLNGTVQALPELIGQTSPGLLMRIDYLGMALAIERCAPYSNWAKPAKHLIDLSAIGALSVTSQSDTPVVAALANPTGLSVFGSPDPQSDPGFGVSSEQTEASMELDRAAVRDLQARLFVTGFDPNGVDGSLGKGARSALSAWQASMGVASTGFLNPLQLEKLKQLSQEKLAAWLQTPANAAKYNATQKKKRKKRRVRVCKRNAIGVLYDCKYRWR